MRSGFEAVSKYLDGNYEEQLWRYFEEGKPAIDELLNHLNRTNEKEIVLNIYRNHIPNIHLYDGVIEILRKYRDEGKKIGLITDGRPEGQRNKIHALGLERLVDDIIITDELGGTQFRKPCDIAFRIMQNRWRLSASEVVCVGDNPAKDFQPARQLGMKSIWYKNADGLYYTDTLFWELETIRSFVEVSQLV